MEIIYIVIAFLVGALFIANNPRVGLLLNIRRKKAYQRLLELYTRYK